MSKPTTTNISIRMDNKLKEEAEKLFNKLGMNLSTAFNIFVRQSLRERRIPFVISCDVPSTITQNAMNEAENLINDNNSKRFSNIDDLFDDFDSWNTKLLEPHSLRKITK